LAAFSCLQKHWKELIFRGALKSLINALVSLQGSRIKDEAAKDDYNSADYVEHLGAIAMQHRAVIHPYLKAMAAGTLPSLYGSLQDFALHYYGYSAHFPRYLTALISKLEKPEHRAALLANLTEESGQYEEDELMHLKEFGVHPEWIVGIPHPVLFKRFRDSIGVDNTAMEDDHIEVVCWREQFLAIINMGSAAEALGALGLGTETIVRAIYQPFVDAIQKVGTIKPEDAVFFPLHTAVDDHHQAALKAIATDFATTPAGRADLAKGMMKALALRGSFWSWLYERAHCSS
jgi:pyrroloquinoline quinone (PQQ) biosynthesis protein C